MLALTTPRPHPAGSASFSVSVRSCSHHPRKFQLRNNTPTNPKPSINPWRESKTTKKDLEVEEIKSAFGADDTRLSLVQLLLEEVPQKPLVEQ